MRAVPDILELVVTCCGEGAADVRRLSPTKRGLHLLLVVPLDPNTEYEMTLNMAHLRRHWVLAALLLVVGGWYLRDLFAARPVEAQTLAGIHGDRSRIMLGFRVKSGAVQARLPVPWQLHPVHNGPLQGANFIVVLVDRVRDDDPEGKPKSRGAGKIINFVAPAKHPQTAQTASIILSGWASNPDNVPGFFQVYRAATIRVEQLIKSQEGDMEEATDVWEVRDATGSGGLELRLRSRRQLSARTRVRGEVQALSAKDPALWRLHRFDAATDVVKSVPEGSDRVLHYTFHLTAPGYDTLLNGSE